MKTLYIIKLSILTALILLTANKCLQAQSTFSGERLRNAVLTHIKNNCVESAEVSVLKEIEDVYFRQSGVSARFAGDNNFRGTGYVAIEFVLDNKVLKRIESPYNVKIFEKVPVSSRNIQRGETIRESDIAYQHKEVTYFNNKIDNTSGIIGREAKVNIPQNSIFTDALLKKMDIIKRGSKVEIRVLSGAVQISTSGSALQDASAGEQVRVRRDGTQSILTGVASDDGAVLITLR